jgi:hypothetical protein
MKKWIMAGGLMMALALQAAPGFDAKKTVAAFEEPVPEKHVELTEWMGIRHEGATQKDLPRILLIGDSIVGNYNGKVKELLKGKAYVSTLTTTASFGNPLFDIELELVLKHFDYEVIHINNGLHGEAVPLKNYKVAMDRVYTRLQKSGATVIAVTTTPQARGEKGKSERMIERNDVLRELAEKYGYEMDDLFSLVMVQENKETLFVDSVHYNEKGAAILAAQVAMCIEKNLK